MENYKNIQPLSEFDWEAFEKGTVEGGESHKEQEASYDKTLGNVTENDVVEGTVISINKREVVVSIGFKSDGIVPVSEFRYNPELQVGDKVEVYIENQEDKKGQLVLSHKKARLSKAWDRINQALQDKETIKGFIKCRTKGGMIVDVFGIEAFLPGSQIDVKPIRDYDIFVGKTMEFQVVKINQEYKNVVVSHKALIEAELEAQKQEIISKLQKGQVLEGTVKNITSYGVFIDLGGVDGLIHITDLSWGRVNDPHEVVHGAFVEIAPGVEGLIHVSEMSWSQHLRSAQDFLKVGDEVEAVILTLDRQERKMSLGIKQLKEDPWKDIEEKYPVGSKHQGKVRNFTNFGVFVELEEGVDGLVHISDLSWTKKVKHPSEFTQLGAELDVVVLEIDKANRRLSLGHKQLEENPWDKFEGLFEDGSIHEGKVVEILDKGAVIQLEEGVEGFATPKHLVKEDGSRVQLGETLPFKVIEFNKDNKRVILSHSRTFEDPQRAERKAARHNAKKEESTQIQNQIASNSLGDNDALAALKAKMEQGE